MIEVAKKLKDCIQMLCTAEKDLQNDLLNDQDWKNLDEILQLLALLKSFTLYAQSKDTSQESICSTLPIMIYLLSHLETAKSQLGSENVRMKASIDLAWSKLNKYYDMTDDSLAYALATVLNPRAKLTFFKKHWRTDEIKELKTKLRAKYEEYKQKREDKEIAIEK